ncbi:hypothetical protein M9458_048646, partial [Cirrhinus mrigala]
TLPRPVDPAAPPWLLAPAPPWSVIDHLAPGTPLLQLCLVPPSLRLRQAPPPPAPPPSVGPLESSALPPLTPPWVVIMAVAWVPP